MTENFPFDAYMILLLVNKQVNILSLVSVVIWATFNASFLSKNVACEENSGCYVYIYEKQK